MLETRLKDNNIICWMMYRMCSIFKSNSIEFLYLSFCVCVSYTHYDNSQNKRNIVTSFQLKLFFKKNISKSFVLRRMRITPYTRSSSEQDNKMECKKSAYCSSAFERVF